MAAGRSLPRIAAACGTEIASRIGSSTVWTLMSTDRSERRLSRRTRIPAARTRLDSRPRWPPSQTSSAAFGRSRSDRATARAGYMCPPVPPPAISRRIVPCSSFDGLARDRQQDADGGEADGQRRSASTDERQCDAGHRDERDDDADVDERLDAQPGGDPRREERPERIGRRQRRPDAGIAKHEEQADDDCAADQPEFLPDDRKDVVVARVRQEEPAGEPALAEACPEDPAETQREQSLDRMETDRAAIAPRVEPGMDPIQLVALESSHGEADEGQQEQRRDMGEGGPGQEEHDEAGQADDDRRT